MNKIFAVVVFTASSFLFSDCAEAQFSIGFANGRIQFGVPTLGQFVRGGGYGFGGHPQNPVYPPRGYGFGFVGGHPQNPIYPPRGYGPQIRLQQRGPFYGGRGNQGFIPQGRGSSYLGGNGSVPSHANNPVYGGGNGSIPSHANSPFYPGRGG